MEDLIQDRIKTSTATAEHEESPEDGKMNPVVRGNSGSCVTRPTTNTPSSDILPEILAVLARRVLANGSPYKNRQESRQK